MSETAGRDADELSRLDQTRDDTDEGWGDWRDQQDRDQWFQEERPPHWE